MDRQFSTLNSKRFVCRVLLWLSLRFVHWVIDISATSWLLLPVTSWTAQLKKC